MSILITICARGGSKGILGKNIKSIGGKPLLYYTINIANEFGNKYENSTVVLSTDSLDIKDVAAKHGLVTEYTRPDFLANDTAGKIDAIKDILLYSETSNNIRYDYILDLDVTSPLRTIEDLEKAFNILKNDGNAVNLFSVSPPDRNPYFNMVEKKENGYYSLVKQIDNGVLTRQSAPHVYSLNASFYFYKRCFFDLDYKGAITDKSLIYEVPHLCFDLDHPLDFEIMSYLVENNKLGFNL